MYFDIFHSLGRVDSVSPSIADRDVFANFFSQVQLAEKLGFGTIWVAESHFSSEVQKENSDAVIPNYSGELGLNCDFGQLALSIISKTESIGFGTAIHNIVGGNGGPISSADRVRSLLFYNSMLDNPRDINIGVASGRFPYINKPFGIIPRNETEKALWPQIKRLIFLEAYEIFFRLTQDEILSSADIRNYSIDRQLFRTEEEFLQITSGFSDSDLIYEKRWEFDKLKLVPDADAQTLKKLNIVLGSHDPMARELAFELGSPDVFNLSFTPPAQLQKVHSELETVCQSAEHHRAWKRSRLPRTVLVFIDKDSKRAVSRAESCFDTYIDAMKGTVVMPPREALMERALIGSPEEIRDQIADKEKHGFHDDDRLMIWIEFNQKNQNEICDQMKLFSEEVVARIQ